MNLVSDLNISEKLKILTDAAKYDVACTSSGVDRRNKGRGIGDTHAAGICHTFSSDGRCVSLLKILMTNECIYDCKYCVNRRSNDVERCTFTPDEICRLTIEFYRRNYIEGLFLSSGIIVSPDYTMGLIYEAIYKLRTVYQFYGYIHVKGIPGASPEIIEMVGRVADRMSINMEFPTKECLNKLAPNKKFENIFRPMEQIRQGIEENRNNRNYNYLLKNNKTERTIGNNEMTDGVAGSNESGFLSDGVLKEDNVNINNSQNYNVERYKDKDKTKFVPAGQSTQMIIGATKETDLQLLSVTQALYDRFKLKRVFYSAFVDVNHNIEVPALSTGFSPLLREHRLYQADWLLRFYGFHGSELLDEKNPNFNALIDPKCDWAIRHIDRFPVEIMRADYYTLLRVPGIGVKSARRILTARRYGKLDEYSLKKMGVVLKRAAYFITCCGKSVIPLNMDSDYIARMIVSDSAKDRYKIEDGTTYRQMSIMDLESKSGTM